MTIAQAVELFKARFRARFHDSEPLIDGEGYEDEDMILTIHAVGDQIAMEQVAAEVSHEVEAGTGYVILAFVQPSGADQSP